MVRKRKKGVSPLVAAVLLLGFTLSVSAIAGPFFSQLTQETQTKSAEKASIITDSSKKSVGVVSARYNASSNQTALSFQNTGTEPINDVSVTVYGDQPYQVDVNDSLAPGEVSNIYLESSDPEKISLRSQDTGSTTSIQEISIADSSDSDTSGSSDSGSSGSGSTDSSSIVSIYDSFEDGTYMDDWTNTSESSVEPDVNQDRAYNGSYSLDLSSSTGSSTRNAIRYNDTFSGQTNITVYLNKYKDSGSYNAWSLELRDNSSSAKLVVGGSGYNNRDVDLKETDESGSDTRYDIRSELPAGKWTKVKIAIRGPDEVYAEVAGSNVTIDPQYDWINRSYQPWLDANAWGGGTDIDAAYDSVNISYSTEEYNYNSKPKANFTSNTTFVEQAEIFEVNASASSDSDGFIESYAWDWTNDGVYDATGQVQNHSYNSSGNKTIRLRVTDNGTKTDHYEAEILVNGSEPKTFSWKNPSISNYGGIARNPPSNSIDDDTATYVVIDDSQTGYVTYNSSTPYKQFRLYTETVGDLDVTLEDGTTIISGWDPRGGWNTLNLSEETGGQITQTTKDFKIQIFDSTNKRLNEVDVYSAD